MKKNRIIWTAFPDFKVWEGDLRSEHPDADENELYRIMLDTNADYLEDERLNLNVHLPEEIICIADLGLWNGRRSGYKELHSCNIADCLFSSYEPTWFVDEYGDLRCDDSHHDGTNHYVYRMWKPGLSQSAKDAFLGKIYEGSVTKADILRFTRRIGDYIADVYGWIDIKGRRPSKCPA